MRVIPSQSVTRIALAILERIRDRVTHVDRRAPRLVQWRALRYGLPLMACASQSRMAPLAAVSEAVGPSDYAGSMVVAYPPPPAQIETVPPAPSNPNCVYLDGQWQFGPRDWQWTHGSWVIARSDCLFAPSRLFWHNATADRSELRFRPGHWVTIANPSLDCPTALPCPGQ